MTFVLHIANDEGKPGYKQVVEALCQAISDGRLSAGEKMPSIRELAKSIAVSPATVTRSYEELARQGLIKTVQGSGAFVSDHVASPEIVEQWKPETEQPSHHDKLNIPLSAYGNMVMSESFLRQSPYLHSGAPLIEDLSLSRWRELLNRGIKFDDPALLAYESDPMGYLPLREALAAYLLRTRSVKCSAHQIAVFPQVEAGNDLIARLLIRPGDSVVFEDPCYPARLRGFRLHGANIVGIPVDQDGMVVDKLSALNETVRLVHVTPSHHDPLGFPLSIDRRHQLLEWAHKRGAFVMENDFDSEYFYGAPYLPAMQGLDEHDLVIYRYTFWRVLFPLVRMSILVLPRRLIPIIRRAQNFLGEAPLLEQKALADFIQEGHLDRHIKRTRSIYESRRVTLIRSLTQHFQRLPISTAGMHLLVTFPLHFVAADILACAEASGLEIADTCNYYYKVWPKPNEFMLGFAYYSNNAAIKTAVDKFATSLLNKSPTRP